MTEKKTLLLLYIITAVVYLALLSIHPYPFSFIIRPIPILLFAWLCFKYLPLPKNLFLGAGFLCCAGGDIFLDVSREHYFIQALICFLIGHILYSIGFLRYFIFSKKRIPLAVGAVLYTTAITLLLIPRLGSFLVPVCVYILVITFMGICAAFVDSSKTTVFTGAMIFIISDSLIAINKFLQPFAYSTAIIISIYFIAQYIIGSGILDTQDRIGRKEIT